MVELAGVGNKSVEFANEILNFTTNIARVSILLYHLYLLNLSK